MYQKWHNRCDPPCLLHTFDIQRWQMTQPYNSSLRTHKMFSCFASEITEGQKLRETQKRLRKEKFWIREHKVKTSSFTLLSSVLHAMYCKTWCSLGASCPEHARLLAAVHGQLHGWVLNSAFSEFLQVPRTSELYVHRSGRTARAANEGLSLLLIGPEDLINFRKIYKTLEKSEELPFFPVDSKCMTSIKVKK